MKKIICILLVILILFTISAVNAEDVQSNENLTEARTVSGDTFDEIQLELNNATSGDVIELEGSYKINKKPIIVSKSLTIQGSKNGAVLDGKKLDSIIEIKASNVILKGLTFQNSKDSAIIQEASQIRHDLTIINCTFKQNGGGWDGGIIFDANFGSLTIINSTFENNKADFGGAIYSVLGDLNIFNSKFTNNVATYVGGAIHYTADKLYIENCEFSNNCASKEDYGGAISSLGRSNIILNSTFTNNYGIRGGAIDVYGNLTVDNCSFTSNSAKTDGGAIYARGYLDLDENLVNSLNILNSRFDSNSINVVYANCINVNVVNSSFSSNQNVYIKLGEFKNINSTISNVKIVNEIKSTLNSLKYTTTYDSGRFFRVYVCDDEGKILHDYNIKVVVYTGSKSRTFYACIYGDAIYAYFPLSKLAVGKHKVKIYFNSKYYKANPITTKIIIKQAKITIKAKKVTAKYKRSKKFTVKVKHKTSYQPVNKLKLKIKVYTGKKFKKFIVKTDKNGVASINTKKLKRGYHKVVITSKNKNYDVNKKSSIIIR